ncbi:MAG TPA: hypothetical protein VEL51_17600 [Vicinamibacterales bacterium]|nr:hypothetical protein [Vicinamibacterales bacterium]
MRHAIVGSVLAGAAIVAAHAQQSHQHADGRFGTVAFSNSCSAEVQPAFARGMALLHSFEFGGAIDAFKQVSTQDPSCGIAWWGIGLAQWSNPFSLVIRSPQQLQTGRATAERAAAAGAKTDRERAYIAALATLFAPPDSTNQRQRIAAYRDAMAKVAATYPDDAESAAFYALSLAAAADPTDKSYADQLKAGAILEKLWTAQPEHPGLAHYIIHSYDVPALAPRAITAARRYATIAPDAPHALHMPSHTFTRLGYWEDSIATNILSAAAAQKSGQVFEQLHATDYEVYAYLQTGQDSRARELVDTAPAIAGRANTTAGAAPPAAGGYALAAIPARYLLERGAWADAARLQPHANPLLYVEAITWFARGLGGARSGDPRGVSDVLPELQSRSDRLTAAGETYWAEQVAIQKLTVAAWLALAEGRTSEALASMREAADREDRTEKAAISPGPLAPARELLAEMLLQVKQPKAALVEFEKTMAKEPNRFRGVAGAAAAAEQAGDRAAAREYCARLRTIAAKGDTPGRPELQAARAAK